MTCDDDVALYYEIHGEGEWPLLLLSGLGGGAWSWTGQLPYLSQYYRTIVFDNRGAGRSDAPPGPWSMERFARDALNLLDFLQVEQTFAMGLSMGGMIAQELALMQPERIRAMILGSTHCGGDIRIPPEPGVVELLLSDDDLSQEESLRKKLPLFLSNACLTHRPQVAEAYVQSQLAVPKQSREAFLAQLEAIAGFNACERLPGLNLPVLIVAGSNDILVPRENAYILAEILQTPDLVVIPGAGHALHAECADALCSLADNFFQQHTGDGMFHGFRG